MINGLRVLLRTSVGNFLRRTAFGWDLEGKTLVNPTVWDTNQQGPVADWFRVSGFGFRVSGLVGYAGDTALVHCGLGTDYVWLGNWGEKVFFGQVICTAHRKALPSKVEEAFVLNGGDFLSALLDVALG